MSHHPSPPSRPPKAPLKSLKSQLVLPSEVISVWRQCVLSYSPQKPQRGPRRIALWPHTVRQHKMAMQHLWQTYTLERKNLKKLPLNTASWVAPYLMGFHLPNLARNLIILDRAQRRGLQLPWMASTSLAQQHNKKFSFRVIDLGCGAAAASLAIWSAFKKMHPQIQWEFELFDRSRHLIQAATSMLTDLNARHPSHLFFLRSLSQPFHEPETEKVLTRLLEKPADLTVLALSYIWNEIQLHRESTQKFLNYLKTWAISSRPAWVLLAEPATENAARSAQKLRDHLIGQGWLVQYPCPLPSHSCPMMQSHKDWCYSEFTMEKPAEFQQIEKVLGLSRQVLGVSGYLFLNPAAARAIQAKDLAPSFNILVGQPQLTDQKRAWLLCDGESLKKTPAVKEKEAWRGLPAPS